MSPYSETPDKGSSSNIQMEKIYPKRDSLRIIMETLNSSEKEKMLEDLYNTSVMAVKNPRPEFIEALRQILVAWEYTAILKTDLNFLSKLEEQQEDAIKNTSGKDWREVIGG